MRTAWGFGFAFSCALLLLAACSSKPKPAAVDTAKGAFDSLRKAVQKEIKDPARASEAVDLVDQMEQLLIEAVEARKAHRAKILSLNANYDSTEEDFRATFKELNAKRDSRQDRSLAIAERARTLTTPREWEAISKNVAPVLEAAMRAEIGM